MISIFRKKNKYIFSPAYFFIFIIIIFCSCSSNKNLSESQKIKNRILSEEKRNNKRSNNNFLAYHNSYYLAKTKFQDAFDLMNKEENSHNQSLSSFTLFDDAIKYASIVTNDFQNTIFFEDAAYIIARSSYYKNLLSPSTFYFKVILDNKVSPYYFDSLVRLGFINLRLGNKNDLMKIMEELEYNVKDFDRNIDNLKKKIPYKFLENELLNTASNYFLLKAEISKSMDRDHLLIEKNYLRAIETATTNNHKKDIYSQLILFFETLNDKNKVLKYINKLKDEFDIDEDSDDLMINWYDYNRKLGFFEDIHDYLDNKLLNDLSTDKEIYYSIEKAKTYVEQNNFIEAENTKTLLLTHYPNSLYAKILTDPDFKKELLNRENELEEKYQLIYQDYLQRNFSKVIASTDALQKNEYETKYMFLRALSFVEIKDTVKLKKELQSIINIAIETKIGQEAQYLLSTLNDPSKMTKANEIALLGSPYLFRSNTPHMSIIIVPKQGVDINYLKILISDYHAIDFENEVFEISAMMMGLDQHLLMIKTFTTVENVMSYTQILKSNIKITNELNKSDYKILAISMENFIEFYKNKDVEGYCNFFKKNYLDNN